MPGLIGAIVSALASISSSVYDPLGWNQVCFGFGFLASHNLQVFLKHPPNSNGSKQRLVKIFSLPHTTHVRRFCLGGMPPFV
jgi:hypothetical protein